MPAPAAANFAISRVLIMSADVAGGHDAAAAALAQRLRHAHPRMDVMTRDGLALMGPAVHHLVRDGYAYQLKHARWSYRLLFALTTTRLAARVISSLLSVLTGRRLARAIDELEPELIVSTYPLCTSVLGGLRLRGRTRACVAAIITDADPHRLWFARGVDVHLVCTDGDVGRAGRLVPWARVASCAPIVALDFADGCRVQARLDLGMPTDSPLVLVSGGIWAVGPMCDIVQELLAGTDAHVAVACGHNEVLRTHVMRTFGPERVTALGYCNRMPDLLRAIDVLVATGPGLTVLETITTQRPVVIAQPISGHGIRSARAMREDGMATYATDAADIARLVNQALKPNGGRDPVMPDLDPVAALGVRPEPASRRGSARPAPRRPASTWFRYPRGAVPMLAAAALLTVNPGALAGPRDEMAEQVRHAEASVTHRVHLGSRRLLGFIGGLR